MKNLFTKSRFVPLASIGRLLLKTCLVIIALFTASFNSFSQTIYFSQWANEAPGQWTNGALNSNNSNYYEGASTLQRAVFTDIVPLANPAPGKTANDHTITFSVLATKGGVHAYDFVTGFDQAIQDYINITGTSAGIFNNKTLANLVIQDLPNTNKNPLRDAVAAMYGGANTAVAEALLGDYTGTDEYSRISVYDGINYPKSGANARGIQLYGNAPFTAVPVLTFTGITGDPLGDSYGNYMLTYQSTSTKLLILMGGHLAIGAPTNTPYSGLSYGIDLGSSDISGGPYHFKLDAFDGAPTGNKDNQIMAGAIDVFPLSCMLAATSVCAGETKSFTPTGLPANLVNPVYTWSFTANTAGATFVQSNGDATSPIANTPPNAATAFVKATTGGGYTLRLSVTADGFTEAICTAAVTVNPLPDIEGLNVPAICAGALSASITFTGVTNGANEYRIDWKDHDQDSNTPELADVAFTALPTNPKTISIPSTGSLLPGSYEGDLYVKNTTTGCISVKHVVILVVNSNPGKPSVAYFAPACDEATFKIRVSGPDLVAGAKYVVLKSNGSEIATIAPASTVAAPYIALAADVTNGYIEFSGIPAGSGYKVTVTTAGGCASGPEICPIPQARIAAPTTQPALGDAKDLIAYPVPFSESVTVEFRASKDENYVINLYDLQGHLVRQLKAGDAKAGEVIKVQVSGVGMAESMYLVRKVSKSGISTVKLLKKE